MPADLYDVLGVPDDAAAEELKRAYRKRVREYHPDVNDHPEGDAQFKLVRTAHDVLSDPAERKTYDRLGHREYVEKHLDDLPPVSVFPDEDLPDGASTTETATDVSTSSTASTSGTTEPSTGGPGDTSTDNTSTTSTTTTQSGSATGTAEPTSGDGSTGSSTSTADERSTGSSRSTANERSSTAGTASSGSSSSTGTTDERATTAGAERDSWDAATSSAQTATGDSSVPAGVRRRRGLKRWYGVVVLSLLVYAGGLGVYALPRLAAIREFVGDVTASPAAALLGPFPLGSPTAYVLEAARAATAGTPTLGLVLLAGTVLLPLVVLTTVGRFGRGAAWLYALPSLAPGLCLAVWPVVAVPTVVALLGLIVLPVLSAGGFLVDVGRYLLATR
ncbi:DnaJ domain-containing protein [Halolamina sp. CBA1230]|uniref:DnaJ domain-containing protein n=1 Tax=Halolamina sp. CBA1230 TaxID=1853690 RepID=UPI0009A22D3A|nr:DnaJ domain-containing protein [Halolamina sp. CBA1230]QKY19346.1 DnaJ domain-containing protein [Halolamina sp. CBA1230]